ncbi:MAG: PAS domain-containing protein, partial [Deltaproteobacteria bacterium]|nr:PAS domain-containing protein [Deltaproteobacteria bacterium]MBW2532124.1 PAS domain-containing protein [Deltaproteobacteria bacterium]
MPAISQSLLAPLAVQPEVLDSVSDGVYLTDRARRITYWNDAAERITGFSAAQVIGKRCSDHILVHVDEAGRTICGPSCPLSSALDDGLPHSTEVYV